MFPDNKYYDEISLLEIEPYACGKGFVCDIGFILDDKKIQNKISNIKPNSAQSTVFTKIIYEILKNNIQLEWTNINQ